MKKQIFYVGLFFAGILTSNVTFSQEDSISTDITTEEIYTEEVVEEKVELFHGTRLINAHTVESLRKGVTEFRVEHRFGDLLGDNGGAQTFFGLDNSSDIRIALEYGVTDNFMVGFGRSKGNGNPYRALLDGFGKYRILRQSKEMPLSLSFLGTSSLSYSKKSTDISSVAAYPEFAHRIAYSAQLNIAKRFHERFSMALMPTLVHRNYVQSTDANTLFSFGAGARIGITPKIAFLVEYFHVLPPTGLRTTAKNSLGIAIEWITFGHNFTIYAVNASGFGETQFITNTTEDWLKGQFRLGFCIGRKFERE